MIVASLGNYRSTCWLVLAGALLLSASLGGCFVREPPRPVYIEPPRHDHERHWEERHGHKDHDHDKDDR